MLVIDAICTSQNNPDFVISVNYSSANGTVNGDFAIDRRESPNQPWVTFDNIQASSEPKGGNGTCSFDCGAASRIDKAEFRYRCTLTDSKLTTPESTGTFPPGNC